ncbi:MAG: HlyD family efflux transporter periplasmic adaptor subunit [Xanthomonadales bacterium]|nr:HlyD family efflux transporter periplasmic adaptor subunit [Xanthomonadales bacterium]
MTPKRKKQLIIAAVAVFVVLVGYRTWSSFHEQGPGEGFASGNGRLEAIEIDVATKIAGRIQEILVDEGDFVTAGQPLATMQLDTLNAQRNEAVAMHAQALSRVAEVRAQAAAREGDKLALQAQVAQRESELDAARRRLARSETLTLEGASSQQELDDDRARVRAAEATAAAARAQVTAAQATLEAAGAQLVGAESAVNAAQATIARIDADIADSQLTAPRDGRIQFRLAQPGEVLAAGGRALSLVDLTDVYMTFFLPEMEAGRVALGSEVRILLDAVPGRFVPAKVSFVASTAQFTPKTVETASERQKLMFRVKARLDPELLRRYPQQVKTGLPGVAWIRLDPDAAWPAELSTPIAE